MKKNYSIVLISIVLIGILVAGCFLTACNQINQGKPNENTNNGEVDNGSTSASSGIDGNVNTDREAVSDVAAIFPQVFDILDPNYNRYNLNIQTDNGIIYYNENNMGIYRIDPVTGQKSLIVDDGIIVSFAVHNSFVYYNKTTLPNLFRIPISGGDPVTIKTDSFDFSLQILNMGIIGDTLYMTVAVPEATPSAYFTPFISCSANITDDPDILTCKDSIVVNSSNALPYSNGLYYQSEITPNNHSEISSFDLYIESLGSNERKKIVSGISGQDCFITNKYIFYIPSGFYHYNYSISRLPLDGNGNDEKSLNDISGPDLRFFTYDDHWVYYRVSKDTPGEMNKYYLYRLNQETGEIQLVCELNFTFYGVADGYIYGYDFDKKDMVLIPLPD